jgi:probable HAF family extracellular repeat protein
MSTHAFLYSGGMMNDLGTLGGSDSTAWSINSAGQVVGRSDTPGNSASHAFLWSGETMSDLGTLGGVFSEAFGINAAGEIVGESQTAVGSPEEAFLYANGKMTGLGTLGGTDSWAYGINSAGQVVGASFITGDLNTYAFIYSDGTMVDLNSLLPAGSGWLLLGAFDINDDGQIVGDGINPLGQSHAFLLTPESSLPEPGTAAIAAMGAFLILARQLKNGSGPDLSRFFL